MGRGRGNGTSRVPFVSPWERAVDAAFLVVPLMPLKLRQSKESKVSTPRSDLPMVVIVGATSSLIQCATAIAMGQRSVTADENTARCLSGRSTASNVTTSVAVHSPGPAIDGAGLNSASSDNRD
jgi:hypothetical protein